MLCLCQYLSKILHNPNVFKRKNMSDQNHKPYTFDRVVRMVLSVAFVIGFYFLLQRLSSVLVPFLIAVLLAY